jgi:hypothetical protein
VVELERRKRRANLVPTEKKTPLAVIATSGSPLLRRDDGIRRLGLTAGNEVPDGHYRTNVTVDVR